MILMFDCVYKIICRPRFSVNDVGVTRKLEIKSWTVYVAWGLVRSEKLNFEFNEHKGSFIKCV